MPTYYSQVDQDRILNEEVFCGMRNGVFVGGVPLALYREVAVSVDSNGSAR
jgi:hypothetical protein